MKARSLVFGLLVLGLLFSAEFEDIYIRSINSFNPDETVMITNCDVQGDKPTYITVKTWVSNPFGETAPATFYYWNFSTGNWMNLSTCNVLQYGKECQVFLPAYLGGMGTETESLELMRVTMSRGSTTYEAVFEFSIEHLETDKEKIVANKTATYLSLLAQAGSHSFCNAGRSLCCKLQTDYSSLTGLDNRSAALLKECRVDEARMLIENAINQLRAIEGNASSCSAALAEIADAEDTANGRGCNTGAVRTQIDALKNEVRNGNYDPSLSALNSALSSQCFGATVEEVEPGEAPVPGSPVSGGGEQETGNGKPICPGLFILLIIPLIAVVHHKWGS
ncbi:MAG: hypothetical protein AB1657_01695 [Candidatus Micrarchaeota archaeon]